MIWLLGALVVSGAASALAVMLCIVAGRSDRALSGAHAARLRVVPALPAAAQRFVPDERRRMRRSLRALADVVDATHVTLRRGIDGEVLASTGPAVRGDGPSVLTPLLHDGRRVGTLTLHRPAGAEEFTPRQFETACAVAVVLGEMLEPEPADRAARAARSRPSLQLA